MKIISYSLWGNEERYILPLLKNLDKAKELFPGWICYVYISESTDFKYRNLLEEKGAYLILCGESPDSRGMFWRFRAFLEKGASTVIIRDSDSELTERDAEMVKVWEESSYDFYLCRDHPWHSRPIICCCWGARGSALSKIGSISKFDPEYARYADDEKFIAQHVYLPFRKEFLVFADFVHYFGENISKIKIKRKNEKDYIGRVAEENNEKSDNALKQALKSGNCQYRYLIPYTLPWILMERIAVFLGLRKNCWRRFNLK